MTRFALHHRACLLFLFIASPHAAAESRGDFWSLDRLAQLDTRIVGLAADTEGEILGLATDQFGPSGDSGKINKLAP